VAAERIEQALFGPERPPLKVVLSRSRSTSDHTVGRYYDVARVSVIVVKTVVNPGAACSRDAASPEQVVPRPREVSNL